jgi:hypothetical protein
VGAELSSVIVSVTTRACVLKRELEGLIANGGHFAKVVDRAVGLLGGVILRRR